MTPDECVEHAYKRERDEARAERDSARDALVTVAAENERMRPVVEAARDLSPTIAGTGDWACERCRPDSDLLHINPGFRCRPHALQDAIDAYLAKEQA